MCVEERASSVLPFFDLQGSIAVFFVVCIGLVMFDIKDLKDNKWLDNNASMMAKIFYRHSSVKDIRR